MSWPSQLKDWPNWVSREWRNDRHPYREAGMGRLCALMETSQQLPRNSAHLYRIRDHVGGLKRELSCPACHPGLFLLVGLGARVLPAQPLSAFLASPALALVCFPSIPPVMPDVGVRPELWQPRTRQWALILGNESLQCIPPTEALFQAWGDVGEGKKQLAGRTGEWPWLWRAYRGLLCKHHSQWPPVFLLPQLHVSKESQSHPRSVLLSICLGLSSFLLFTSVYYYLFLFFFWLFSKLFPIFLFLFIHLFILRQSLTVYPW